MANIFIFNGNNNPSSRSQESSKNLLPLTNYLLPSNRLLPLFEERAKNCKKGKAFGNSCIAQNKQCRKTLSPTATKAANAVPPVAPKKTKTKGTGTGQGTSAPATDALALRDAINSKDFDAIMDLSVKLYEKGKQSAINAGADYRAARTGGNIRSSNPADKTDWYTTELWKELSYDGLPKVVTKKEMDAKKKAGDEMMYRSPSVSNFQKRFDDFKTGEYTSGSGIYGHGTYVGAGSTTKGSLATPTQAFKGAQTYGSQIMRMGWDEPPPAKVIKQSALELETIQFAKEFYTDALNKKYSPSQIQKAATMLFGDVSDSSHVFYMSKIDAQYIIDGDFTSGRFASLKGYDAVRLDSAYNKSYQLLLNRKKVTVQDTEAKSA